MVPFLCSSPKSANPFGVVFNTIFLLLALGGPELEEDDAEEEDEDEDEDDEDAIFLFCDCCK